MGLVALPHVGSWFLANQDHTHVPALEGEFLNHWNSSDVPRILESLSGHYFPWCWNPSACLVGKDFFCLCLNPSYDTVKVLLLHRKNLLENVSWWLEMVCLWNFFPWVLTCLWNLRRMGLLIQTKAILTFRKTFSSRVLSSWLCVCLGYWM